MIEDIRDFLRGAVSEIDSSLQENPSAFLDDDIGESLLDRSYQITIRPGAVVVRNSHFERQLVVQITIFAFGGRDQVKNYDEVLDKAICIEDYCLGLKNLNGVATITNVVSDGISAEKYPSSDDVYRIDVNLTLTQAYTRE